MSVALPLNDAFLYAKHQLRQNLQLEATRSFAEHNLYQQALKCKSTLGWLAVVQLVWV